MIRRYSAEPVAPSQIDRMLKNAVRAPNAGFSQGWSFLVLDSPDDVARFWAATTPDGSAEGKAPDAAEAPNRWLEGMRSAPVIIVPLSSKAAYQRRYSEPDKGWPEHEEPRWAVPYWHVDAGMAALLILQTVVDEGLGACFFGLPPGSTDAFRAEFEVPAEYAPVGAVTVGHPAERSPTGSATRRRRKSMDDVIHRGHWGR